MSGSGLTVGKRTAALVSVALVLTGAGASYVVMRGRPPASREAGGPPASGGQPPAARSPASDGPLPDVVVPLTPDAIERAGIVVAPVASGAATPGIRLPGVVEPNAYRQVGVTPLVGGRVTRVSVELGDPVRRGQPLAWIYSPELAEVQTKFVAARAMLDAHDLELQRAQKLVAIGAASRQELERIHAEHAAQTAAVESARSQLELLGVSAAAVDALGAGGSVTATTTVAAPIDGIVTARAANVGLNVDPATSLVTLVDLSTVWVVANLYERDFSRVTVGSEATITATGYPDLRLRGRVSYIDPQLDAETRTAKVRVEIGNPRGVLRLGMYADVIVTAAAGASVPVVPRGAVQNLGDRTVVYVATPKETGRFIERDVRLGGTSGEMVEVASGVRPGDLVVTEGSFFVRAERERLGLRPAAAMPAGDAGSPRPPAGSGAGANPQTVKVVVSERGFEPSKAALRAGTVARITFLRTTDKTCATEVAFPSLGIRRGLPLNRPVEIEFTPARPGEVAFACGMKMLTGVLVVQ